MICVNYRDRAVFTFYIDGEKTMKSACLDIERATWTEHETWNKQETYWAFKRGGLPYSAYEIDRLNLKAGVAMMDDHTIHIVGRGRLKGVVE